MDKYNTSTSTYDLDDLQELLKDPTKAIVTRTAHEGAIQLGYLSKQEIINRILMLKKNEIYKTMPADKAPGLWQDVYHTMDESAELYIKLQKSHDGQKGVIIQFKEK